MKYKTFEDEVLGRTCRMCINKKYGIDLSRQDCRYWVFPAGCSCCGMPRNIVAYIMPLSRWKIWKIKEEKNRKNT